MFAILHALGVFVADLFKSRSRLEAENLLLRHQLTIALRQAPLVFDCAAVIALFWMTRLWPSLLGAVQVVRPETVLRWHRARFKMFWRWKSCNRAGRPRIDRGLRDLIRRMSSENPVPSENLIRWIRGRKENRIMIENDGDFLQTFARIYVGLLSFA